MSGTGDAHFTLDVDRGIARVIWDTPDRSVNLLTGAAMAELGLIVERIASDEAVTGVVIASGKESFGVGADLQEVSARLAHMPLAAPDAPDGPDGPGLDGPGPAAAPDDEAVRRIYEACLDFSMTLRRLETCGKPVAAAITGDALGGALEVALACHYRVAADTPAARLGLPQVTRGLMPGAGGTQRLPRLIGSASALTLLLQGRTLAPAKALKQGIVHDTAPLAEVMDKALRWLHGKPDPRQPWDVKGWRLPGGGPHDRGGGGVFMLGAAQLRKTTQGNFPAPRHIMSAVYEGVQTPMDAGLRIEARHLTRLLRHPACRNMVRAAVSRRALSAGARRPADVPAHRVRKVGVIGAGMMGAGIARICASADMDVVLLDRTPEIAAAGRRRALDLPDGKRASPGGDSAPDTRITATASCEDLKDCGLVVEAVTEDRAVKDKVLAQAHAVIGDEAVLASNTSTLPITGLARACGRDAGFIGLHFFSPAQKMPLVEIIRGRQTSEETLARAMDFAALIGKTPIIVNDSRGFYTSRCVGVYMGEAMAMLQEGVPPALIENAARLAGMPAPPLALADEVSLALICDVARQTRADLGGDDTQTPAAAVAAVMVETHGRQGRRNRKGFYDYPKQGRKRLWPGLAQAFAPGAPTLHDADGAAALKTRLLYVQALEAARCLEENVLTDVRDADVGALLGWGFAPWTGGPLSLVDTVGAAAFASACDRLAETCGPRFAPCALLRDMAARGDAFYGRFAPADTEQAA